MIKQFRHNIRHLYGTYFREFSHVIICFPITTDVTDAVCALFFTTEETGVQSLTGWLFQTNGGQPKQTRRAGLRLVTSLLLNPKYMIMPSLKSCYKMARLFCRSLLPTRDLGSTHSINISACCFSLSKGVLKRCFSISGGGEMEGRK